MLEALVAIYPHSLTLSDLGDRLEMTASGGTFKTYLSMLRSNGLAEGKSEISASESLFIGGSK